MSLRLTLVSLAGSTTLMTASTAMGASWLEYCDTTYTHTPHTHTGTQAHPITSLSRLSLQFTAANVHELYSSAYTNTVSLFFLEIAALASEVSLLYLVVLST